MDIQEAEGRVPDTRPPRPPRPCIHPGCRNVDMQRREWGLLRGPLRGTAGAVQRQWVLVPPPWSCGVVSGAAMAAAWP